MELIFSMAHITMLVIRDVINWWAIKIHALTLTCATQTKCNAITFKCLAKQVLGHKFKKIPRQNTKWK